MSVSCLVVLSITSYSLSPIADTLKFKELGSFKQINKPAASPNLIVSPRNPVRGDSGVDLLRISRRDRPEHQPHASLALHHSADRVAFVRHFRDRRLHRSAVRAEERRVDHRSLQERPTQTSAAQTKQEHIPRSVRRPVLSVATAAHSSPLPEARQFHRLISPCSIINCQTSCSSSPSMILILTGPKPVCTVFPLFFLLLLTLVVRT